jgi:hypothetical protein
MRATFGVLFFNIYYFRHHFITLTWVGEDRLVFLYQKKIYNIQNTIKKSKNHGVCSIASCKRFLAFEVHLLGTSTCVDHRVAMATFWRTFHHHDKNQPSLVRVLGGACPPPFTLLPSQAKLWCTLQLRGQIYSPYFSSIPICTLWCRSQMHILYPVYIQPYVRSLRGPPFSPHVRELHLSHGWSRGSNHSLSYCRLLNKENRELRHINVPLYQCQ